MLAYHRHAPESQVLKNEWFLPISIMEETGGAFEALPWRRNIVERRESCFLTLGVSPVTRPSGRIACSENRKEAK